MSKTIKYGIVGAGHLGNYHAQQLKNMLGVKLVGVFDRIPEKSYSFGKLYEIKQFNKLEKLLKECDAVSITTPATAHYQNAVLALQNNCHLFIEKPFTRSLTEAQNIIRMEKTTGLKIQIGHIERFNAAFLNYLKKGPAPQFVESHRLCKYNKRGLDVDVVLDLMIHDIDILLLINPFPIKSICASGASILTTSLDMASVRVEFKNNVSANLTASRISLKQMRQMRIFATSSYNIIDFQNQSWKKWCIENKAFKEQTIKIAPNNALYEELNLFIKSIHKDLSIKVGTRETIKALTVACQIQKIIEKK